MQFACFDIDTVVSKCGIQAFRQPIADAFPVDSTQDIDTVEFDILGVVKIGYITQSLDMFICTGKQVFIVVLEETGLYHTKIALNGQTNFLVKGFFAFQRFTAQELFLCEWIVFTRSPRTHAVQLIKSGDTETAGHTVRHDKVAGRFEAHARIPRPVVVVATFGPRVIRAEGMVVVPHAQPQVCPFTKGNMVTQGKVILSARNHTWRAVAVIARCRITPIDSF